ncbi:MAG: MAPEG family protein [Exilibacterium sp.]
MNQHDIFGPVFTLIFLTWVVWVYMYAKRIPFLRSQKIEPNQITPAELARISPPSVAYPSDNLKNLFEVPVIFYTLALYLFVVGQVDTFYVLIAWVYVLLRTLHSAVHCTVNIVMLRFFIYAISCVVLFAMTLRAAFVYFL